MARKERVRKGIVRSTLGEVLTASTRAGKNPFLSMDSLGRDRISLLEEYNHYFVVVTRPTGKRCRYRKELPVYLLEDEATNMGVPFMRPLERQ